MNFLAIRYLLARKKQTILTLIGIILGTAGYVTISGIMLGFQDYLLDQFINNDCHIRIKARDEAINEKNIRSLLFKVEETPNWITPPAGRKGEDTINNVPSWKDRLLHDSRVESFALQLQVPVLLQFGKVNLAVRMIGIKPEDQLRVSSIERYITHGSFKGLDRGAGQILIGEPLLEKLGARINDSILVSLGKRGTLPFKVIGTFRFGMRPTDEGLIYAPLVDVQSLAHQPSRISDITVRLHEVDQSSSVAEDLSSHGLEQVESWEQANESTLSVFKTQDIVRYAMTVSILVVAGFGIFNVLSMAVTQKRKEIAILRSIGFEPSDIVNLFLFQGSILGLFGGALGVVIGAVICRYLSTLDVGSGRAFGSGHMIISFAPRIYILGFGIAVAASVFSAFLPARSAGKLHPMEIMRSES